MAEEMSAQLQEQIRQLQSMSGQLQQLSQQRAQMDAMKFEADQALEALEGLADDHALYRNVGSLLVKDTVPEAKSRLGDESETLEIRLKRLTTQEEQMKETALKLQQDIQANLPK